MAGVNVRTRAVIRDLPGAEIRGANLDSAGECPWLAPCLRCGGPLKKDTRGLRDGSDDPFLIRLNDELVGTAIGIDKPIKNGDGLTLIFPIGGG